MISSDIETPSLWRESESIPKLLLFVHSDTRHFYTAIFLLRQLFSQIVSLLFVVRDFKRNICPRLIRWEESYQWGRSLRWIRWSSWRGWWGGWRGGWCWSWRSQEMSWPPRARSCGSVGVSGRPGRRTARSVALAMTGKSVMLALVT